MFRQRTEVALLTSQDQARRLEEELEATRKRYDAVRAGGRAAGGGLRSLGVYGVAPGRDG